MSHHKVLCLHGVIHISKRVTCKPNKGQKPKTLISKILVRIRLEKLLTKIEVLDI